MAEVERVEIPAGNLVFQQCGTFTNRIIYKYTPTQSFRCCTYADKPRKPETRGVVEGDA